MMLNVFKKYQDETIELKRPILPILLVLLVFVIGTIGYYLMWMDENFSIFDSVYMTFITMSTIGFSEIHELDTAGRIFTMIIGITGVGSLFYVLSTLMENLVILQVHNVRGKRKMKKTIDKLNDHTILVGYGRVGKIAAKALEKNQDQFVIIDMDFDENDKELPNYLTITGDATQDDILQKAGIDKAKGIIVATGKSSITVFVVLSARVLNPNLKIVARADEVSDVEKLKKAGANEVVNPYSIGGVRLAQTLINPNVIRFIDGSFGQLDQNFSIESIIIAPSSPWIGKTLIELDLRKNSGASIIAAVRNKIPIANLGGDFTIKENDRLLALGGKEEINKLNKFYDREKGV